MTLTALVLLLFLAFVASWRKRRWLARSLVALALLLFLAMGCGLLPRWLLSRLEAPYALQPALHWAPGNAIVLLTGDALHVPDSAVEPSLSAYGRITQAAMLYNDCRHAGMGCKLLVSGGDPSHLGTSLAASYGTVLRRLGVPSTARSVSLADIGRFRSAFFTNTSCAFMPIARIDDTPFVVDPGLQALLDAAMAEHPWQPI